MIGCDERGKQLTRKAWTAGDHREAAIDTARFYAVTGQRLDGNPEGFRLVPINDVEWFMGEAAPRYMAAQGSNEDQSNKDSGNQKRRKRDESGSGHGFRFMQDQRARGASLEEASDAISKGGEWAQRVDDREIRRAYEHSELPERATDLGNARKLVRIYGEDIRYIHAWKTWIVWEDGQWRRDDSGAVVRIAKRMVEVMFTEAGLINDEERRTALRKHALQCQSAGRLAAMIQLAETEIEVVLAVAKVDADPMLLGVQNGVVDLHTGEFREARREDYVTKRAGVSFDPVARCPNWISFLEKIIKADGVVDYLQRLTGYVLTGLTGEEIMPILHGAGLNGKSTFRETLFALMGDYAIATDASLLITKRDSGGATPDVARLHGRRLVTINETKENDVLNEGRVKFITSHDIITARNLYENLFDFVPTHKAILTTNHQPIVRGTDEGIWRRIPLVAFTEVIAKDKRDPNFREKFLIPELAGILNWALEGLKEYQRIGLAPPDAVMGTSQEYREGMDIVGRWIDECCDLDPDWPATNSEIYTRATNCGPGVRSGSPTPPYRSAGS